MVHVCTLVRLLLLHLELQRLLADRLAVQTLPELLSLAVTGRLGVRIRTGCDDAPSLRRLHSLRACVFGDAAGAAGLLFDLAQLLARLVDIRKSGMFCRQAFVLICALWAEHGALLLRQSHVGGVPRLRRQAFRQLRRLRLVVHDVHCGERTLGLHGRHEVAQ